MRRRDLQAAQDARVGLGVLLGDDLDVREWCARPDFASLRSWSRRSPLVISSS